MEASINKEPERSIAISLTKSGWATPCLLVAMTLTLRLTVAAVSIGSNDAGTFLKFTDEISVIGFLRIYAFDPVFNHPPLAGAWAMAAAALGGNDLWQFSSVFRLLPIAADGLAVYLLWQRWRRSAGERYAMWVAAAFAWNLDAILVSGFHCNTDCCYAALCLLCVYLIEEHGWYFWAGAALAAAINVKLIPVLLIPPLLLSCRRWRDAIRFAVGLSFGVVPFLPVLILVPDTFIHNVINYDSNLDRWGVLFFLIGGDRPVRKSESRLTVLLYYHLGRYVILGAIAAWSCVAAVLRRWNRYELCAITFAIFLVLSPGFGLQYTALIGPLLFAASPRLGFAYGTAAGIFLLVDYGSAWTGHWPIESQFTGPMGNTVAKLGLLAWIILVCFLIWALKRNRR